MLAPLPDIASVPRPAIDPTKRTVIVVLGADVTEITDMLGPYEIFARAHAFNVVTAAPSRNPTLLTGGLEIVPHFTFDEIDRALAGQASPLLVVPNIPTLGAPQTAPVIDWLRRRAELLVDPQELCARRPMLRKLWP